MAALSDYRDILVRIRYLLVNAPDELKPAIAERAKIVIDRINALQAEEGRRIAPPAPPQAAPTLQMPIPDVARQIWTLAGGDPDIFGLYLSTYPDPRLNSIGRNPAELNNLINQLGIQQGVPDIGVQDGFQQAFPKSSNVYGFRYDPLKNRLTVRFNEGQVYRYDNVPKMIFDMFSAGNAVARTTGSNKWGRWWKGKSPSIGSAVHQLLIAGGYPYTRIR